MVKHYIRKRNRDAVSRKFSKWNNANEHMFNTLPVESEFQSDTWHRLQNQFCSQWHNCRSLLISLLLKDYKFLIGFAFSHGNRIFTIKFPFYGNHNCQEKICQRYENLNVFVFFSFN